MNKKTIIIICILIIIFTSLYFFISKKSKINKDNYLNDNSIVELNTNNASNTNINMNNKEEINKNMDNQQEKTYTSATLHTNLGDISFQFSKDKPNTVGNFIKLAESEFYNNVKFHRVIEGFMIQTGDPISKDDTQKAY